MSIADEYCVLANGMRDELDVLHTLRSNLRQRLHDVDLPVEMGGDMIMHFSNADTHIEEACRCHVDIAAVLMSSRILTADDMESLSRNARNAKKEFAATDAILQQLKDCLDNCDLSHSARGASHD